jgi:hypothetical protein
MPREQVSVRPVALQGLVEGIEQLFRELGIVAAGRHFFDERTLDRYALPGTGNVALSAVKVVGLIKMHDRVSLSRRERDRSLSHRRLWAEMLPVMSDNVSHPMKFSSNLHPLRIHNLVEGVSQATWPAAACPMPMALPAVIRLDFHGTIPQELS